MVLQLELSDYLKVENDWNDGIFKILQNFSKFFVSSLRRPGKWGASGQPLARLPVTVSQGMVRGFDPWL
jgi:hypothetical protein